MSYINQDFFLSIQTRLEANAQVRFKRGALAQDFASVGCMPGEIFYGNLKSSEFAALPLRTKRKGGPATTTGAINKTFESIFSKQEDAKEYAAVFVQTYELDILGISY